MEILELLGQLIVFLLSAIKFVGNLLFSSLDYIGAFFSRIFFRDFYSILTGGFEDLGFYIGTENSNVLMGLFGLIFSLIIGGFIIRFLKGRLPK